MLCKRGETRWRDAEDVRRVPGASIEVSASIMGLLALAALLALAGLIAVDGPQAASAQESYTAEPLHADNRAGRLHRRPAPAGRQRGQRPGRGHRPLLAGLLGRPAGPDGRERQPHLRGAERLVEPQHSDD